MPSSPVLTAASTVTCAPGHLGAGMITITPSTRLTVGGQGVLTVAAAAAATTTGCTQPVNPSGTSKPCTLVKVTEGGALRLTVDGSPVLLVSTFASTSDGLPTAVFVVTPGPGPLTAE